MESDMPISITVPLPQKGQTWAINGDPVLVYDLVYLHAPDRSAYYVIVVSKFSPPFIMPVLEFVSKYKHYELDVSDPF
jgi:hypothetical protein